MLIFIDIIIIIIIYSNYYDYTKKNMLGNAMRYFVLGVMFEER